MRKAGSQLNSNVFRYFSEVQTPATSSQAFLMRFTPQSRRFAHSIDTFKSSRAVLQAKDAKAAQINADKVVSACRAELLQLSSSLASQHEQASMWEGRAQGLQQQLDQARLDQQLLQQDHSQVVNESAGKEERLR